MQRLHFRASWGLCTVAAAAGLVFAIASTPAPAAEPVNVRIVADLRGPPHPVGIAMEYFKARLAEEIPGSKVRTYYAGALYRIPEAIEAMTDGNLEMTWGQFGKSSQIEPYASVVIGAQLLSTPGAINQIDGFETFRMLQERFAKLHKVKIFASAHLSMYMGAGARFRLLKPGDFEGRKIRSMGPAENAALKAWGANPTTMAFGDVPPALQTGVIDGLLTTLGGFRNTKEQAPYFTVAGINGIVGDYYWVGASLGWWNSLAKDQRDAIENLMINDVIPFQKKLNWCNDRRLVDKYETKDPSKPGIYIMSAAESKALADKLGNATADWIKSNTPDGANEWVDKFIAEATAATAAHPMGSDPLERTDCGEMKKYFDKYVKK